MNKISWAEFVRSRGSQLSTSDIETIATSAIAVMENGLPILYVESMESSNACAYCITHSGLKSAIQEFLGSDQKICLRLDRDLTHFPNLKSKRVQCRIEDAAVPISFRDCAFDNYRCDADRQRTALQSVMQSSAHPFLTQFGIPGTGKTHLAVAWMRRYLSDNLTDKMGAYFNMSDLLAQLRKSYVANKDISDEDQYSQVWERISKADCLILDDFGIQKHSDWVLEQLDMIIDDRYRNGRDATIVTTNLTMKQVNGISPRIASRLSAGDTVVVGGMDYRRQNSNAQ